MSTKLLKELLDSYLSEEWNGWDKFKFDSKFYHPIFVEEETKFLKKCQYPDFYKKIVAYVPVRKNWKSDYETVINENKPYCQLTTGLIVPQWVADECKLSSKPHDNTFTINSSTLHSFDELEKNPDLYRNSLLSFYRS